MTHRKKGNYFGTEIDQAWYKRFRKDGFFARGDGELWLEEEGLCFLRLLTKKPLRVPWEEMTGARLGKWHAGRWAAGRPVLKIDFRRAGQELSAGFLLSSSWPEMEAFANGLGHKIDAAGVSSREIPSRRAVDHGQVRPV
jgi:hypothetical protein